MIILTYSESPSMPIKQLTQRNSKFTTFLVIAGGEQNTINHQLPLQLIDI